ncbi:MAG: hemin uptake protein HemP [Pseudomonadota bacterium]
MNETTHSVPTASGSNRDASINAGPLKRINTDDLFEAATEVLIRHGGADYRLRITANGKLILTK